MGEAFITRRGGGFGKAFAAISVTYPSGSICVCSNGSKTLKAKDTSGSWLFVIPFTGNWTVTSTDGSKTVSETVAITAQYQIETVKLSYAIELIKNGEIKANFTLVNNPTLISADGRASLTANGNTTCIAYTKVDLTDRNRIVAEIVDSRSWHGSQVPIIGTLTGTPSLSGDNVVPTFNGATISLNSATGKINDGTYTLDISKDSGEWTLAFAVGSATSTIGIGYLRLINLYVE